jgi:hypothetical protein
VAAGLSEGEADECQRTFRRVGQAGTAPHELLASRLPDLPDLPAKGQIALTRPG